ARMGETGRCRRIEVAAIAMRMTSGSRSWKKKGQDRSCPFRISRCGELHGHDVRSLQAFRSLGHFELDGRAFRQGAESATLNRREVNEHVLTVLGCDEAKALRVVEPLDVSRCPHVNLLSVLPSEIKPEFILSSWQTTKCPTQPEGVHSNSAASGSVHPNARF